MSKEAMKLALEAFETLTQYNMVRANIFRRFEPTCTGDYVDLREFREKAEPAITALREALAEQPAQQGPVATCSQEIIHAITMYGDARADQDANNAPTTSHERLADCIRLVRKALAEQPAQQEPVATIDNLEQEIYENTREFVSLNVMEWLLNRLNTSPPAQRTWVGLTNKDVYECEPKKDWYDSVEFARAIEAKLKEKNT